MDIQQRIVGKATVLDLTPNVMAEMPRSLLTLVVEQAIADGRPLVVLNLSPLRRLNSSGVALLVGAHHAARDAGGRIVLAGPNSHIRDLIRVIGMERVWTIFPSEAEALQSMDEPG